MTYTSQEVLDGLDGRLSYRMLDHWIRTGKVRITYDAHGSGTRRYFTEAERAAIGDLVAHNLRLQRDIEAWESGALFDKYLARRQGPRRVAS